MRNIRRKQLEHRKRIKRLILLTLGIMFFIYLSLSLIFGESGLLRYLELKATTVQLLSEVRSIREQNEEIKRQIEALKKDPSRMEELAREYGFTKEGEMIFKYEDGE
jgi:cell division protein FtsB